MIRYFIPSDGDDPLHPNIFHLPTNPAQVTLRDVRQSFPLPGTYHFRFKKKLGESKTVWLDVTEDGAEVPTFDGAVLAKVVRISADVPKATGAGNNGPSSRPASRGVAAEAPVTMESSTAGDLLQMGSGSGQKAPTPTPQVSQARPSKGLASSAPDTDPFGLFESVPPVSSPAPAHAPPRPNPGHAPDLLNFDAFGSAPRGPGMPPQPGLGGVPRGMPPMMGAPRGGQMPMQQPGRPAMGQQPPGGGWSQF